MDEFTLNLLGVLGLSVADRIREAASEVLRHSGETPAALVVIGHGYGPSNNQVKDVLGLSHPGTVRLIDRLVAEGLVERRRGQDRREVALYATRRGMEAREQILQGRLMSVAPLLDNLSAPERQQLNRLHTKMLASLDTTDLERRNLCRLCDKRVCRECPIPAEL